MITFAIIILIVAKALPGLNTQFSSIHVTRITSIVFLFAGALTFNSFKILSIGGGIGIYSGFFQVTTISQLIEIFLFFIGGGILIAWPQIKYTLSTLASSDQRQRGPHLPKDHLFQSKEYKDSLWTSTTLINSNITANFSNLLKINKNPLALASSSWEAEAVGESTLPKSRGSDDDKVKFTLLTDKKSTDYSLIVLFSSLGSSLLISSYDLISVYLSIELQSFGLYVLSTLYRDSESSTSAGLKYFLLGGLSSCIILLGTGIIYSYTGTTNLESLYIINSIIDINQQYVIQGISLGLSLIFIGFLFTIAAAPLHNWSPDVYDGTPTIVTTWLTIIPKIAILFILLELQIKLGSFGLLGSNDLLATLPYAQLDPTFNSTQSQLWLWGGGAFGIAGLKTIIINSSGYLLKTLLLISATLSLIIGSLLGLAQIRIKRLLAYSTISHIGFILLALAVNTEQSIDSFIFYIIQYTITNLNIFLIILGLTYYTFDWGQLGGNNSNPQFTNNGEIMGHINPLALARSRRGAFKPNLITVWANGENKEILLISEFKGLFFSNPLLSISLAISLFSMAGIPPLIGFFSKQLVLYSALQNGYYFISLLAIIVSVISCSYYLQIIKILITPSQRPPLITSARQESEGPIFFNYPIIVREGEVVPAFAGSEKYEKFLTNTHSYLISILTFTILLFFIKPSLILNSTQLLSLSLFYI